jgi:glucosamine-6-phosphate deaminase
MGLDLRDLHRWCSVPVAGLERHPDLRTPLRICADGAEMARLMATELADAVLAATASGTTLRAIIPCGPRGWYQPFADLVNTRRISLAGLVVFHMDECLDWQARPLPAGHPYNFRAFMEASFYAPVDPELRVPEASRHWPSPASVGQIADLLAADPADLAYGGWGQDGHVAYNQARRQPYSPLSVADLRTSTARVQENNPDTIIALAQREFGAAYQFVPPMSVTLGMREILGARRVRLFSDTGAWKQTALRVGLFSEPVAEYPITLLQEHPDALLTATRETATHPISLHPEWDLGLLCGGLRAARTS